MDFVKFLLACEPYLFVWGFVLFFKIRGMLDAEFTSWTKLSRLFVVSLAWIPVYWLGYRYEAMLFAEVFTSAIVGWPYIRYYFRRSAVLIVMFPLMFVAWLAQATAVRFEEFVYPSAAGEFFLGWFDNSPTAGILGYSIWLGATMPKAEIIWYTTYMLKVLSEFCIVMYVLPDDIWERPQRAIGRAWVGAYLVVLGVLVPLQVVFSLTNTRVSAMAMLVIFTMALMLAGYVVSARARAFMSTRLYSAVTIVMFVQYAVWEWIHSGVLEHWKYLREHSLGSLSPVFAQLHYPDIPGVSNPWYLPVEELGGYLTVYPTMLVLIILLDKIPGLALIRGDAGAAYFRD